MTPILKKFMENMKMDPELYENVMGLYEGLSEPKDLVYYAAPVILFVFGPKAYAVSCALAYENIMLTATSLGLASEITQALELTEGERIYGPILLGYPKDAPEKRFMDQHDRCYVEPTIKWI